MIFLLKRGAMLETGCEIDLSSCIHRKQLDCDTQDIYGNRSILQHKIINLLDLCLFWCSGRYTAISRYAERPMRHIMAKRRICMGWGNQWVAHSLSDR